MRRIGWTFLLIFALCGGALGGVAQAAKHGPVGDAISVTIDGRNCADFGGQGGSPGHHGSNWRCVAICGLASLGDGVCAAVAAAVGATAIYPPPLALSRRPVGDSPPRPFDRLRLWSSRGPPQFT